MFHVIAAAIALGLVQLATGLRALRRTTRPYIIRAARGLWTRRASALSMLYRLSWWSALLLLLRGGATLGDVHSDAALEQVALPMFLIGLGLCVFVLMMAAPRRLRIGAFALAFAHGSLALLTWVVTTPL